MSKETAGGHGLRKMRATGHRKPEHKCPNCKCVRYTTCGCIKKGQK